MKKFLTELLQRLSSRKFVLTVFGIFAVTAFPAHADHVIQLIVVFVGAEGAADVVERYKKAPEVDLKKVDYGQLANLYNDAIDSGEIEPGHTPAL